MTENDDHRSITMSRIVTPEKANFTGDMHGGYLLQFLDEVAYTCAVRYCGHYVVTLSVDHVLFKQPIHVGELVTCYANINYVGRTSMEIGMKVTAENLETHNIRHTNSCYFTMVAIDDHKKPTAVKPLEIKTNLDRRRHEEAVMRKEMARTFAEEHKRRKTLLKSQFEK